MMAVWKKELLAMSFQLFEENNLNIDYFLHCNKKSVNAMKLMLIENLSEMNKRHASQTLVSTSYNAEKSKNCIAYEHNDGNEPCSNRTYFSGHVHV